MNNIKMRHEVVQKIKHISVKGSQYLLNKKPERLKTLHDCVLVVVVVAVFAMQMVHKQSDFSFVTYVRKTRWGHLKH